MNLALMYPMFAVVILTFLVTVLMFVTRIRAVRVHKLDPRYFKTFNTSDDPPEFMLRISRHYTNLFEVPTLFYAGCLLALVLPVYGGLVLFWAWLFVLARLAHTFIHLGSNRLYPRIGAFALGWLAVVGLWVTIVTKDFLARIL